MADPYEEDFVSSTSVERGVCLSVSAVIPTNGTTVSLIHSTMVYSMWLTGVKPNWACLVILLQGIPPTTEKIRAGLLK